MQNFAASFITEELKYVSPHARLTLQTKKQCTPSDSLIIFHWLDDIKYLNPIQFSAALSLLILLGKVLSLTLLRSRGTLQPRFSALVNVT